LASYEEWQSWDAAEGDANENNTINDDTEGASTDNGNQQFGRLSTCLLEKKLGKFRWIHVHETWMEAEEPMIVEEETPVDEDSVMTGPAPPTNDRTFTSTVSHVIHHTVRCTIRSETE
jgi:hypothetical protein